MAHREGKQLADEPTIRPLRSRRWFRRLIVVLGVGLSVYIGGANYFLNSSWPDRLINRKPEKMMVTWASGWTVVPGVVHVRGLELRGQQKKMQWYAELGKGTFTLNLLALPFKTLSVVYGRGSDFSFRSRRRLAPDEAPTEVVEYFPEIPGFSNPPERAPEDLYPKRASTKKPWTITLRRIGLQGSIELWLNRLRVTGEGTVNGGMDLELRADLAIPKSRLKLKKGSLTFDSRVFADDLELLLQAEIDPFVPRETKGLAILEKISGQATIKEAVVPDFGAIGDLLPAGIPFALASGSGSLELELAMTRGREAEGRVGLDFDDLDFTAGETRLQTDLDLEIRFYDGDLIARSIQVAESTLSLDEVTIADEAAGAEDWWAKIALDKGTIQLAKPLGIEVDVGLHVKNLRPILALVPTKDGKTPTWMKLLPDFENLKGRGVIETRENEVLFDDIELESGELAAKGRIRLARKQTEMVVLLEYKKLVVGLERGPDGFQVKLAKPRTWYEAQPPLR